MHHRQMTKRYQSILKGSAKIDTVSDKDQSLLLTDTNCNASLFSPVTHCMRAQSAPLHKQMTLIYSLALSKVVLMCKPYTDYSEFF